MARSTCPISIALELIGDPWSLLIVRDLVFKGCHTFKEFLEAGEGISSNVLADRLRRLESAEILEQQPDPEDGRRVRYALTRKGVELAPVLTELVMWSARHHKTGAPTAILRLMREQREAFIQGVYDDWSKTRQRPAREQPAAPSAARRSSRKRT